MPLRLRVFVEPQQGASYDDQLAVALAAEAHGFDAFFRSDHLQAFQGAGLPGPTDAWVTLAGLARETTRLRLGTMVTPVTFRFPGVLAITVAQVDTMSGGRVELGLGAGWFDAEHHAHGIPFPPLRRRFDLLEDTLAIVDGMWSTPPGGRFSYTGREATVVDSPGLPKPLQPRVPIIIGGAGAVRTPALTARFADECNTLFHGVEGFAAQRDAVRRACEAIGRDPGSMRFSVCQTVCCASDGAALARRAAAIGQPVEQLRAGGLAGTPGEVVEKLARYAAAGADCVYLQVLDLHDLDHLALLGTDVLPHV